MFIANGIWVWKAHCQIFNLYAIIYCPRSWNGTFMWVYNLMLHPNTLLRRNQSSMRLKRWLLLAIKSAAASSVAFTLSTSWKKFVTVGTLLFGGWDWEKSFFKSGQLLCNCLIASWVCTVLQLLSKEVVSSFRYKKQKSKVTWFYYCCVAHTIMWEKLL